MRIAIISFDQEFSKQLKDELEHDNEVRVYIDSLGMLRDLKEFHPDIIVYDASAGEFAIDDLKFLMTRDKLENNEFKIFISETDPINVDELPKNIKKEIFTKDKKGIEQFISKMKIAGFQTEDFEESLLGGEDTGLDTSGLLLDEEPSKSKEKSSEEDILMQTPEDIEELLMGGTDFLEEKKEEPKPKKEEKKKEEPKAKKEEESRIPSNDIFDEDIPIEDIESILGELGIEEPEPAKEEKKEVKKEEPPPPPPPKEEIKQEKKKKTSPEDFLAEFEDFFSIDTSKRRKKKEAEPQAKKEEKREEAEYAFSPEDIEDLLTDTSESGKAPTKPETPPVEEFTAPKTETPKPTGDISKVVSSTGAIKIELTLSQEELKQLIVNATVEKMVDELKKDKTLKELIQDVQKDFIDRTEKELEGLKEVVKKEVKTRLLKKIEEDLKDSIKESIKRDVMEITTKLVKQKLEQLFGGK